jgi:hypothetical protein
MQKPMNIKTTSKFSKRVKTLFSIALFLVAFNTIEHICHNITEGFTLGRIQFAEEAEAVENVDPVTFAALNQTFRYFAKGNQCFVFISEDGQSILKFFKYARHTPPAWTAKVPLLNKFKPLRKERIAKTAWKRERDFCGYRLAFDHFREESGLVYLHLKPAMGFPTIAIFDKLGIRHTLDLGRVPFVLQKKATPVFAQFATWLKNGEKNKIKAAIPKLVALCQKRLLLQLDDDDVNFYSNTGFVEDTPILIDPGHFTFSDKPLAPAELKLAMAPLEEWLKNNYPPLVLDVQAALH